jgi:hypothetical protein
MKAKDRLTILENVIARVGLDGPVLEEYTKALATHNGISSMQVMQPIIPPQAPVQPGMPPMGVNTTPGEMPPQEAPMGSTMA